MINQHAARALEVQLKKRSKTNSSRKGKEGERAAAKYLEALGFPGAKRTQQHCGAAGDSDVIASESLPGLFVEVKFGYPLGNFDLDKTLFQRAVAQATSDAGNSAWVILWKPYNHRLWRLTTNECLGAVATFSGDEDIRKVLRTFQPC